MGPRLFSLGEVLCRFVSVTLYIHGGGGLPGHRTKITKGKGHRTWQCLGKQLAARIKIAAMVPRLEGRGEVDAARIDAWVHPASMGPRLLSRGEVAASNAARIQFPASMGPRFL